MFTGVLDIKLICVYSICSRGIIFGIWSANASVGNIIGALQVSFNLDIVTLFNGTCMCKFSLLNFFEQFLTTSSSNSVCGHFPSNF